MNHDAALERYEFLEAMLLVAVAKYRGSGKTQLTAAKCLATLSEKHLDLFDEHLEDPDDFRRHVLYLETTDAVYVPLLPKLEALYTSACLSCAKLQTSAKHMLMAEFLAMCTTGGVVQDMSYDDLELVFVLSKLTSEDEQATTKHKRFTFYDFLEALWRIAVRCCDHDGGGPGVFVRGVVNRLHAALSRTNKAARKAKGGGGGGGVSRLTAKPKAVSSEARAAARKRKEGAKATKDAEAAAAAAAAKKKSQLSIEEVRAALFVSED